MRVLCKFQTLTFMCQAPVPPVSTFSRGTNGARGQKDGVPVVKCHRWIHHRGVVLGIAYGGTHHLQFSNNTATCCSCRVTVSRKRDSGFVQTLKTWTVQSVQREKGARPPNVVRGIGTALCEIHVNFLQQVKRNARILQVLVFNEMLFDSKRWK